MGYGRGYGIEKVYDIIIEGKGTIYGLELSEYMRDVVEHRFALELADSTKKIILDNVKYFLFYNFFKNIFSHLLFH